MGKTRLTAVKENGKTVSVKIDHSDGRESVVVRPATVKVSTK